MSGRDPDFVVVGAMKAATTSLFRWLGEHPGTAMPAVKEPRFFSHDDRWERGVDWYRSLMPDDPDRLTGEASPSYTDPRRSARAAARLQATLPRARLVFIVREPAARARSQYLHELRKARERRPFGEAVADLDGPYVERSCYHRSIRPYLEGPTAERLLVVRFEDLTGPDDRTWQRVLSHLGLDPAPRPSRTSNAAEDGIQYTPAMRAVTDRGLHRRAALVPRPLRRVARRVLTRSGPTDPALVRSIEQDVPGPVEERWAVETEALATALGWDQPVWLRS